MKLAFCIPKYFPYGGLQSNFLRIARRCRERGHEITVYTLIWEGDIPHDFRVRVIPLRARRNHARNVEFVRKTQPLLAQGSFDGVIGFFKMPGLDIYYAADPCYQTKARQRKSWLYRLDARYRTLVALEAAVFAPRADTEILMLTEPEIANYSACYGTPRERFHLLPPGIERDRIAPDDATEQRCRLRAQLGIEGDERLVLMVGSDYRRKGLGRTLQAVASLPLALRDNTRLMVLGQSDRRPFERLARRLGVAARVRFLGARDDVPRFLLAADLLIHPAYVENTGNVLLEALVAGLPVLTTANCGYAFHVERAGAGRVVPKPFEQEALNANLKDMLVDPTRLRAWSRNAIAYGRQEDLYSRPETATTLIETLLGKRA